MLITECCSLREWAVGPRDSSPYYSVPIAVSGGIGPYLWFQGSPGFPAGLAMEGGTGVISGFPGASGTYTFVLGVMDSSGSRLDGGLVSGAAQQEKRFTILVQ
jgi:Putative Ig domain